MSNPQLLPLFNSITNQIACATDLLIADSISLYEYWRFLKELNDIVTSLVDDAKPKAFSQLSTMPKDVLDQMGVTLRKGYAQWSFEGVTYAPYLSAKAEAEIANKKLKAIEDQLKTMAKQKEKVMPNGAEAFESEGKAQSISIVDKDTGECVDYSLPIVKGYTQDSISFKKA